MQKGPWKRVAMVMVTGRSEKHGSHSKGLLLLRSPLNAQPARSSLMLNSQYGLARRPADTYWQIDVSDNSYLEFYFLELIPIPGMGLPS